MKQATRPILQHDLVFVVDDEPALQFTVGRKLKRAGWRVETFPSPPSVLERVENQLPILVVSDLVMPDMTGLELLQAMRKRFGPHVPAFILMTAYSSTDSAREALRLGATDYLLKPFDPNLLVDRVQHAVRTARLHLERAAMREVLATDLRAQLGAVEMTLHALERGDAGELSPEQRELVRLARAESGRMHRLVHNLDDLHLLEDGVLHTAPEVLSLEALWEQARERWRARVLDANEAPALRTHQLETPPWIHADRELALRLCECLFFSAHNDELNAAREARLTRTAEWIRIHIGPLANLPRESHSHSESAFAPSARALLNRNGCVFNTEMELSLAHAIARTLGGRLRLEAGPEGSELIVELPAYEERSHE